MCGQDTGASSQRRWHVSVHAFCKGRNSRTAARLRSSSVKRGLCANPGSNREKTRKYASPSSSSATFALSLSLVFPAQGHRGQNRPSARYPPWSVDDLRSSISHIWEKFLGETFSAGVDGEYVYSRHCCCYWCCWCCRGWWWFRLQTLKLTRAAGWKSSN